MKSFTTNLLYGVSSLVACGQSLLPIVTHVIITRLLTLCKAIPGVLAQATSGQYTDPETGIVFSTSQIPDTITEGGFTWGFALPPDAETVDATEYLGLIVSTFVLRSSPMMSASGQTCTLCSLY